MHLLRWNIFLHVVLCTSYTMKLSAHHKCEKDNLRRFYEDVFAAQHSSTELPTKLQLQSAVETQDRSRHTIPRRTLLYQTKLYRSVETRHKSTNTTL